MLSAAIANALFQRLGCGHGPGLGFKYVTTVYVADETTADGGLYAFFRIEGVSDVRQAALDLVDEANVGLAPGTAFGPGGEGYFRLCFARKSEDVEEAMRRIETWLKGRPA